MPRLNSSSRSGRSSDRSGAAKSLKLNRSSIRKTVPRISGPGHFYFVISAPPARMLSWRSSGHGSDLSQRASLNAGRVTSNGAGQAFPSELGFGLYFCGWRPLAPEGGMSRITCRLRRKGHRRRLERRHLPCSNVRIERQIVGLRLVNVGYTDKKSAATDM